MLNQLGNFSDRDRGISKIAGMLIVPGFILLTFWCLIVPFIVLGGSGVFESFGNSWRTVRGYAWRVFGTYVLVFLILIAFAIVVGFVLMLLPLWLRSFVNNLVSGTLIAPFLALVATLIYYRLTAAHAGQPYTPHRPSGCQGLGAPAPHHDPQPSGLPSATGGLHARPCSTGFDEAASHAGSHGTRPDRAPAGSRPRRATTPGHPLTRRIGHFHGLRHDHDRFVNIGVANRVTLSGGMIAGNTIEKIC